MIAEWLLITPPVLEPLTLEDAKLQGKIYDAADDALVLSYISAARQAAESKLSRGLLTQTWKLELSSFADLIWLPMAAPLQSVTSVKYYNAVGSLQTLAPTAYVVDVVSRPGRIVRAPGASWPELQADRLVGSVVIEYVVGWSAANLVPERIKQGLRLSVGASYHDREGFEDRAADARAAAESCWDDVVYWIEPSAS